MSPGAAGLAGWVPIFLNDATLALVSLIGFLTLILLQKFSSIFVIGLTFAVLILAAGFGALLWCLTHREKLTPLAIAIAKFTAKFRRKAVDLHAIEMAIGRIVEAWDTVLDEGWRRPMTGAAVNTDFDMLTLAFLFLAVGHGVNPLILVAGYGVPQLLGKLTIILGGVGVVETTIVGLYGTLGVPTPISVVVLVYRLFSFWRPTLAGIALVPSLEHRQTVQ